MRKEKHGRNSFSSLPLNIDLANSKTVNRQIRESNPSRIKPGEIVVISVDKWYGLSHKCYAVMNIDGKDMKITPLRES
jgi:hypothetical protein